MKGDANQVKPARLNDNRACFTYLLLRIVRYTYSTLIRGLSTVAGKSFGLSDIIPKFGGFFEVKLARRLFHLLF